MKNIVCILLAFIAISSNAQILEPVKWTHKTEKKSETNYVLVFDATIEKDWHVYSQFTDDGGSLPLELTFKNQKGNFTLVGKTKERGTKTGFNDVFGVNETFWENKIHFEQEIKITNLKLKNVDASVDYQACKASCVNLVEKFKFVIPEIVQTKEIATTAIDTEAVDTTSKVAEVKAPTVKPIPTIIQKPIKSQRGLWSIFFIAFLSGFAALLTPCVFPLIPMTVSFFTKQSKTKAAGIKTL